MIIDANVLLYAVDAESTFHDAARAWLEETLNGPARVGLPWASLLAFQRISTHPRASASPLSPGQAWSRPAGGWRDRKSTRLNSSHANISYAVFCLKKKNKRPI